MSRNFLAWTIVPICLFLVTLGMRVPDLVSSHGAPKPGPRAIIECASKGGQDATAKKVVTVVAICPDLPVPLPPVSFRTRHHRETCRYQSVTLPRSCARAPPVFPA